MLVITVIYLVKRLGQSRPLRRACGDGALPSVHTASFSYIPFEFGGIQSW